MKILQTQIRRRGYIWLGYMAALGAAVAYGAVAGLFFLLPVVGPILMVPSASVGGLWLLCRLDKDGLRPPGERRAAA